MKQNKFDRSLYAVARGRRVKLRLYLLQCGLSLNGQNNFIVLCYKYVSLPTGMKFFSKNRKGFEPVTLQSKI